MTKVIVVEDEELAAQKLIRQLKNLDSEVEVLSVLDSVSSTVEFLSNTERQIDLIFLDIHLGDDISFNIFDKIKVKTPIIFTTAYDQYAIQAFKVNSVDYLLKPVNKNDLREALAKFYDHRKEPQAIDYQKLLSGFQSGESAYQKRFMVYKGDKVKSIKVAEIAYFFAEGKYVYLVAHEGQEYLVDYTLDKLQSNLDPTHFFRINRQYVIQISAIQEMIAFSKGRLKIILAPLSKKEAIVSTDRAGDFKKWLNK